MTQAGTVELYDSIFTLGTDLSLVDDLVEKGWGELVTRTRESTDEFVELTGGLLGTGWSGATRDSFAAHRSNLTRDLDATHTEMVTQRDAAAQLLATAKSAESRLQDALGRLAPLGAVRDGEVHRVPVRDEAELDLVSSVVAEAHGIKQDLHGQVEGFRATFERTAFVDMSDRWSDFIDRHHDTGSQPPRETFAVPGRDRTMATRNWQGRQHFVSTDTAIGSVEVTRREDTGWYVVKFDDTYHYVEPGRSYILIRSQGETYEMDLETGLFEPA